MSSSTILEKSENFILEIQRSRDWSEQLKVQKKAAKLCGKFVEWLTAESQNDENFSSLVCIFFAMLKEAHQRKVLPLEDLENFSALAKEKIHKLEITDEDMLDFLEYNTSLDPSQEGV